MTQKHTPQTETIEYEGATLEVVTDDGRQIVADNDHGRFLFHRDGNGLKYITAVEIFGARCEPHITL